MPTLPDYRPLHRRALADAADLVARIGPNDFARPTPCADWDLQVLIAHAIGQNYGFADAAENGDAPVAADAHRSVTPDSLQVEWATAAERLTNAFAAASLDHIVRLAEFKPVDRFPVAIAVGFQLLDTTVHSWDIATSLGHAYRPDEELVDATLALALKVPQTQDARERPGAAFAPVVTYDGTDGWDHALALLGRR